MREQPRIDQAAQKRATCQMCGKATRLLKIEPAAKPAHELRSYKCEACGYKQTDAVLYR